MTTPTTSHDSVEKLREEVQAVRDDLASLRSDMTEILSTVSKFWEQFQLLKDSPMLSAFFPAPRKK